MQDLFKKAFHLGLGLASTANEKIQSEFESLVEKGKITQEEAEEQFKSFQEDFSEKKETLENSFYDSLLSLSKKMNFSESEELKAVKTKLEALEEQFLKMMQDKNEKEEK